MHSAKMRPIVIEATAAWSVGHNVTSPAEATAEAIEMRFRVN